MYTLLTFSSLIVIAYARPQYQYYNTGKPFQASTATGQNRGGDKYLPPATIVQEPLITKQFYLHTAPPENNAVQKSRHLIIGRPQKNYRVIFIKAPAADTAGVRLSAEYAPIEEKTVIYVLSQKEQELDLNNIAAPSPTQPSKPEVFFIKYKTAEEASAAQKEIQGKQLSSTSHRVPVG